MKVTKQVQELLWKGITVMAIPLFLHLICRDSKSFFFVRRWFKYLSSRTCLMQEKLKLMSIVVSQSWHCPRRLKLIYWQHPRLSIIQSLKYLAICDTPSQLEASFPPWSEIRSTVQKMNLWPTADFKEDIKFKKN